MQTYEYQWLEFDRVRKLSAKKANAEYGERTGNEYGFDTVSVQCDLLALAKKNDENDRKQFWEGAAAYLWALEYISDRSMTLTYEQALEHLYLLPRQRELKHDCCMLFDSIGWPEGWSYARNNQESWDRFMDSVDKQYIPLFEKCAQTNPRLVACERGRGNNYRMFATLIENKPRF